MSERLIVHNLLYSIAVPQNTISVAKIVTMSRQAVSAENQLNFHLPSGYFPQRFRINVDKLFLI